MQKDANLIDFVKSFPTRTRSVFQRIFGCENQRRYCRERASQSSFGVQAMGFNFRRPALPESWLWSCSRMDFLQRLNYLAMAAAVWDFSSLANTRMNPPWFRQERPLQVAPVSEFRDFRISWLAGTRVRKHRTLRFQFMNRIFLVWQLHSYCSLMSENVFLRRIMRLWFGKGFRWYVS